jgi:hypothetical protein
MDGFHMQCSPCFIIIGCYPPVVHVSISVLLVLFQEGCKVFSHCSLEECGCIAHPKVHDIRDVCSIACLDCCFVFILISKSYIVVPMSYVKLQKEPLALKLLHCCSYSWHWIVVPNGPSIYSSVVDNDSFLTTIFLANKEDGGDILGCSFFDTS